MSKKDVADFQKEAKTGKDADVKTFAGKTLPTLQDHLKMVQDLNSKMAGNAPARGRRAARGKGLEAGSALPVAEGEACALRAFFSRRRAPDSLSAA